MKPNDLPADIAKELERKTLKLSEAIRIGARMRPQGFLMLCSADGATCALGAAAHARGWKPVPGMLPHKQLSDVFNTPLWYAIGARNDFGHQSRESIADWLQSIGY